MNLPIGAVTAIVLMLVRIPDPVEKQPYSFALFRKVIPLLDLPGFALLAPACVMFLLALQFGGDDTYNWNSPTIIGLFCGAGVVAIIFILWEAKVGDNAMIPGALLKNRIVVFSSISTVSLMVVVLVGSTFLPIYFQAVRGVGPTESGVDLLPSILSQLLFALISGAAGKFFCTTQNQIPQLILPQYRSWGTISHGQPPAASYAQSAVAFYRSSLHRQRLQHG